MMEDVVWFSGFEVCVWYNYEARISWSERKICGHEIDKSNDNRASSSDGDGLRVFLTRNDNSAENPELEIQTVSNALDSAIVKHSDVGANSGIPNKEGLIFMGIRIKHPICMESVHVVHEQLSNTAYGFFLDKRVAYPVGENYVIPTKLDTPMMLDYNTSTMCMDSWGRSSNARSLVELRVDVKLEDTLVVVVPKYLGEGYTMSTICVEYEWTPPRCSSCKVFGYVLNECPKKIVLGVLKNLKNSRQGVRGVQLGTNGGNSKLAEKWANSDVVSSTHETLCEAFGLNTTPLETRINDLEIQIMGGKLVLVDDDGQPLKKVDDPINAISDSEVDEVFNETAGFMASTSLKVDNNSKSGSGVRNKSLYEQWRET
ncbi:hypothetical protein Tco_1082566, partial [Tanacetum coccineum]